MLLNFANELFEKINFYEILTYSDFKKIVTIC